MQQVFHTKGPQILGVTVPNTIARAKWHPRFVHGWLNAALQYARFIKIVGSKHIELNGIIDL